MISTYVHKTLEESDKTTNFILDIISEGLWDWNALTGYVHRSVGWYRMLEYDVNCFDDDVITWENIIHEEDYSRVMEHFEAYINAEIDTYKIQYRCKKANGTYLWIEDSGKIVQRDDDGKLVRMIGAHTDIHEIKTTKEKLSIQNDMLLADNKSLEDMVNAKTQELENLNKQLKEKVKQEGYYASYDPLTKIHNRRVFNEMFILEISRVQRYSQALSIMLLDIDDFKVFNDSYGHKVGDEILVSLAALLKSHVRVNDTVARWGGEEFIVLFPNSTKDDACKKAQHIRKIIEDTLYYKSSKVTCSFGVTEYIEGESPDEAFVRVDKALYQAKENGRNKVYEA